MSAPNQDSRRRRSGAGVAAAALLLTGVVASAMVRSRDAARPAARGGAVARVAIPVVRRGADAPVAQTFGRAPFFVIFDLRGQRARTIRNPYADTQHAAGLRAARRLVREGVDAVVAANFGMEPGRVFPANDVQMYLGAAGTARGTIAHFPAGLQHVHQANVPAHFGVTGKRSPTNCRTFDVTARDSVVYRSTTLLCPRCRTHFGADVGPLCPQCSVPLDQIAVVAPPASSPTSVEPQVRLVL